MKYAFWVIIICLTFASCSTSKKMSLAQRCAKEYPCADTAIVFVKEYADTLLLQPDAVIDSVTVPCPPGLTDTVRTTVVVTITPPAKLVPVKITVRDTANARIDSALRVAYKELELKNTAINLKMLTYEAERNEARKSAKRGWWSWVLVGVLAAALLYVLFKKKKITIWRVLPDSFAYSAMAPVPDLILLRRDVIPSDRLIRHERIHHAQQRELFLIGFWIWYLLEFVVRLIVTRSWPKAYRQISFEAEAAKFQFGGTRKPFGWINFL